MGAHDTLDIDGPGGVTLVVFNGSGGGDIVRWTAGAQIDLIPQGTGSLAGLLMYVPYANQSLCSVYPGSDSSPPCRTISLVGNADSNWSGTIFAPDSLCKIEGDNTTVAIDAQAICYTVDIGGGGNWTLQYTGGTGFPFNTPAYTELNR
jgi:hypothetical protein